MLRIAMASAIASDGVSSDIRRHRYHTALPTNDRYKCDIVMSPPSDPSRISGKIRITPALFRSEHPLKYYGIVVELEAELTTSFGHRTRGKLLVRNIDPSGHSVYKSRIHTLVSGNEGAMQVDFPSANTLGLPTGPTLKLNPHGSKFNFELQLPPNCSLPTTLGSKYGQIQYFIVCYLRTEFRYIELERRPFVFQGHNPIHQVIEDTKVVKVFTRERINVTLNFLPEISTFSTTFPFSVSIESEVGNRNPSFSMGAKMTRVIKFSLNGLQKEDKKILDTTLSRSVDATGESELYVEAQLCLQKQPIRNVFTGRGQTSLLPTFNLQDEPAVKLVYFLECGVYSADYPTLDIKFVEEIIVGTKVSSRESTRQTLEIPTLITRSMSLSPGPPEYCSQLSSRQGSLTSIETLPPHYEDVQLMDKAS